MGKGGARKGAGPKHKFGLPTKPVRIPIKYEVDVLDYVEELVKRDNEHVTGSKTPIEMVDFTALSRDERTRKLAKMFGISVEMIKKAAVIMEHGDQDLIEAVSEGRLELEDAIKQILPEELDNSVLEPKKKKTRR